MPEFHKDQGDHDPLDSAMASHASAREYFSGQELAFELPLDELIVHPARDGSGMDFAACSRVEKVSYATDPDRNYAIELNVPARWIGKEILAATRRLSSPRDMVAPTHRIMEEESTGAAVLDSIESYCLGFKAIMREIAGTKIDRLHFDLNVVGSTSVVNDATGDHYELPYLHMRFEGSRQALELHRDAVTTSVNVLLTFAELFGRYRTLAEYEGQMPIGTAEAVEAFEGEIAAPLVRVLLQRESDTIAGQSHLEWGPDSITLRVPNGPRGLAPLPPRSGEPLPYDQLSKERNLTVKMCRQGNERYWEVVAPLDQGDPYLQRLGLILSIPAMLHFSAEPGPEI